MTVKRHAVLVWGGTAAPSRGSSQGKANVSNRTRTLDPGSAPHSARAGVAPLQGAAGGHRRVTAAGWRVPDGDSAGPPGPQLQAAPPFCQLPWTSLTQGELPPRVVSKGHTIGKSANNLPQHACVGGGPLHPVSPSPLLLAQAGEPGQLRPEQVRARSDGRGPRPHAEHRGPGQEFLTQTHSPRTGRVVVNPQQRCTESCVHTETSI